MFKIIAYTPYSTPTAESPGSPFKRQFHFQSIESDLFEELASSSQDSNSPSSSTGSHSPLEVDGAVADAFIELVWGQENRSQAKTIPRPDPRKTFDSPLQDASPNSLFWLWLKQK